MSVYTIQIFSLNPDRTPPVLSLRAILVVIGSVCLKSVYSLYFMLCQTEGRKVAVLDAYNKYS